MIYYCDFCDLKLDSEQVPCFDHHTDKICEYCLEKRQNNSIDVDSDSYESTILYSY